MRLLPPLCALIAIPTLADVVLHDFRDVSVWKPNPDGGNAPQVAADTDHAEHGPAMSIRYADREPHWGNLTGPSSVPPNALALRFWVYKKSANTTAAMHIWLMEPDGDAWLQRVTLGSKGLDEAPVGWNEARLPVSGFSFEPRGPGTREMTRVNRMLLGCNFSDLEVSIANMTWETGAVGEALPLPKTQGLQIETGKLGSVGILDMGDTLASITAHPPAKLAAALREAGFGATILKPGDLADPAILTPERIEAVILVYGPYFPFQARDAFVAYLKAGGSFLSTDGYAFDKLVQLTAAGWAEIGAGRTAAQMDKPDAAPQAMNTRLGKPGDAMDFSPDQIGVFDPQFPLEHATEFRGAAWIDPDGQKMMRYAFDKPVTGFSACGLIGVNSPVFPDVYRRWVPVLEAFDRDGGALRGTALSIMHNYTGAFAKSSWAFSGLTSKTDLFLDSPGHRFVLGAVMGAVTAKIYLHELSTDLACYEKGETATVQVKVSDFGRRPAERTVELAVAGRQIARRVIRLIPGDTQTVSVPVKVDDFRGDYLPVTARLTDSDGHIWDAMSTAFCKRSPEVLASGPKLAWQGNYMTVNGRAAFMVGSNQTGMMFYSPAETPAVWDRDFANMAAHSFHILRILHFSPYAKGGYQGNGQNDALDLANRPTRLVRQLDAIVQLAQKHRVAIFLSLHDWMGLGLTDEQLKVQADWDRFWAERYKDVPGVFFDIQNEPSVDVPDRPDIVALWNRYLQDKYKSDDSLKAAWTKHLPEAALPNVPFGATSNDWEDMRSVDRKRFETEILNRWVKANADGIRAGNPKAMVTVGYLPWNAPADRALGTRYLDFSNMHYYGATEGFMTTLKSTDRRFVGKGFTLGECGAEEAHNARTAGSFDVPVDASIYRFQTYVHYGPAMGAGFICNWDWKDFDEMIFPWGLMQRTSSVPKPWLHTWEEGALLLSFAEPVYESPQVFILAPDSNRIGPHFDELHGGLNRAVDLMFGQRVNFGMLNEDDLSAVPASAKAIVWPLPYCPTDETFDRVLKWVQAGGTLYLSGDISFDSTRKPTRADRRATLGLPEAPPASPFATPESAWSQKPIEAAVGAGKVLYVPYPLELRGHGGDSGIYAHLLDLAGVSPIAVEPSEAPVRALSIPARDGGRILMLASTASDTKTESVTVVVGPAGHQHKVSVDLARHGYAFIITGPGGEVRAAESQGRILIDGVEIASGPGHFAIATLDGGDLRTSKQILILPHQCEQVSVAGLKQLDGASCVVATVTQIGAGGGAVSAVTLPPHSVRFAVGTTGQIAVIAPTGQLQAARKAVCDHLELRFGR